ncbi:PKS-NRPS hybrid synthetase CHGG_01239-like [Tripterygium wilfordii]|uniref:PKS-NRPS hybrid synthetase CHGG_01239-like n=1 Tax=Tripterygium wilfordii TaxID=458696 RepID=UPI0018F86283|nr:PKS-NRPS hybrid synthetase CHGG_01239-like [Tripterygium wilfordii]
MPHGPLRLTRFSDKCPPIPLDEGTLCAFFYLLGTHQGIGYRTSRETGLHRLSWSGDGNINIALQRERSYAKSLGSVKNPLDLSEEEWNHVIKTNLTGTWLVSKYVRKRMRDANQGGSIINISSIAGIDRGQLPGAVAYAASKAGLNAMTKVFSSRQSLIEWVQNTGHNLGFVIVTKKSEIGEFGRRHKLLLQCDRGGCYKSKKNSTRLTGTKKRDCPFRVKGMKLKIDDDWMVRVVCGVHNHFAALYMEGHSYVGKLSTTENEILVDMSKNLVKPRNILYTLKNKDPDNVSTIKTIYNARQKFRTAEKAGKSQIQQLMSFLHQYEYVFFNRSNAQTNELEELFFAHPGSIELLRAFPHVLLIDATYKTNRFRMPLFEIVGVTSTKMTFCVGCVFLQSEKEDNYTRALNCLRLTMDESTFPSIIVTDKDLAWMRSCAKVFSESMKLLDGTSTELLYPTVKNYFETRNLGIHSTPCGTHELNQKPKTENAYVYNLSALEMILQNYSKVMNYIKDVWLMSYKEMFISAWTGTYMHFGNLTTNRAESQHSKLKRYLGTPQSDLESVVSSIHQLIQVDALNRLGWNLNGLKLLVKTYTLADVNFVRVMDCHVRTSLQYTRMKIVLYHFLVLISFGKNLTYCQVFHMSMMISTVVSSYKCSQNSLSVNQSLDPIRHNSSSARPSAKKKVDRSTSGDASAFKFIQQEDFCYSQEPGRHSCSSIYSTPPLPMQKISRSRSTAHEHVYLSQFPSILQPYIMFVKDVKAVGNCDFRAIAGLLGFGEDAF